MMEQGICLEPTDLSDPEDLRVVAADMRFAPLVQNGQVYNAWKISDTIRLKENRVLPPHRSVLNLLISPEEERVFAQILLDAAEQAEEREQGGSGIAKGMHPPTK